MDFVSMNDFIHLVRFVKLTSLTNLQIHRRYIIYDLLPKIELLLQPTDRGVHP